MKLLVTGGSGFLGRAIIHQLCEQGQEVINFSRAATSPFGNLAVRHYRGDLTVFDDLMEAMKGCEGVFHVAARTGLWGDGGDFYATNVKGTEHVIRACRELGIRYLVYTSSASVVYQPGGSEGQNETMPYPDKFYASYPETKARAEQLVIAANGEELKTVSLRPHLIWGPGDSHYLPRLFEKSKRKQLRLVGDGNNLVDSIYIDNAAKAHLQAFTQLVNLPAAVEGRTFFISQGAPLPISDFINQLIGTGGFPPVTRTIPAGLARWAGRIMEAIYRGAGIAAEPPVTYFLAQQLSTAHWYDISAARKSFGYEPEISTEEGMKRLRDWVIRSAED
ncbi:NAD-dependent epimerase/dehydratase family protein [Flavihumibacter stibioxidans]|uniref:3-beta hydroxysteroid dehydrogenase n=1 Tax=Flavihumibacter stibioxidans TaxID=1834163 RepID=A0ABR7MAG3_9BACT|nr:NAD-dependent epimerase/dehydratase family protein [Flavihumibacter stibioxidans]MBC6492042.1 3-beta hydroxysteroid dehydrogenase [Flavihumibacter stibioxidans]